MTEEFTENSLASVAGDAPSGTLFTDEQVETLACKLAEGLKHTQMQFSLIGPAQALNVSSTLHWTLAFLMYYLTGEHVVVLCLPTRVLLGLFCANIVFLAGEYAQLQWEPQM